MTWPWIVAAIAGVSPFVVGLFVWSWCRAAKDGDWQIQQILGRPQGYSLSEADPSFEPPRPEQVLRVAK